MTSCTFAGLPLLLWLSGSWWCGSVVWQGGDLYPPPSRSSLQAVCVAPSKASLAAARTGGFGRLCSVRRALPTGGMVDEPAALGKLAGSCSLTGGCNQLPLMSEPD